MKKRIVLCVLALALLSGCNSLPAESLASSESTSLSSAVSENSSGISSEPEESPKPTASPSPSPELSSASSEESEISASEASASSIESESSAENELIDISKPAELVKLIGKKFGTALDLIGHDKGDFEKSKKGRACYVSTFTFEFMGYDGFKLHFSLNESDDTVRSCWLMYKSFEVTDSDLEMVLPIYESLKAEFGDPDEARGEAEHFSNIKDISDINGNFTDYWSVDGSSEHWISLSAWNGTNKESEHNMFSIALYVEPVPRNKQSDTHK